VAALIIDDDDDGRELLAEQLRKQGFSVATASNGREALDLLHVTRPAVIFLDICMPIMDGACFREEQRHHRDWIAIPTIVMTATNEEPLLDLAVEATLHKPVSAREILSIVRRHCSPETA
jgi:CheY-like chemotaxis protein